DRLASTQVTSSERAGSSEVRVNEWIHVNGAVPGEIRGEIMVVGRSAVRTARIAQGLALDREADRLSETRVVAEQRRRRVHDEQPEKSSAPNEEARLVDAVASREIG